jgi:hypothetical protein
LGRLGVSKQLISGRQSLGIGASSGSRHQSSLTSAPELAPLSYWVPVGNLRRGGRPWPSVTGNTKLPVAVVESRGTSSLWKVRQNWRTCRQETCAGTRPRSHAARRISAAFLRRARFLRHFCHVRGVLRPFCGRSLYPAIKPLPHRSRSSSSIAIQSQPLPHQQGDGGAATLQRRRRKPPPPS